MLTIGAEESIERYLTRTDGTQLAGGVVADMMVRAAEATRASQPREDAEAGVTR